MRAAGLAVKDGGGLGFYGDDLHVGVLLLQKLTGARDGATGAYASHEDIDLAVGGTPDLGTCGGVVDSGVGSVLELLEDDAAGDAVAQGFSSSDGTFHAVLTRCETYLGAIGFHEVAALYAHGLRHCEDEVVALDGADEGEAYACVAAGRLDDGGAGLEDAVSLSILDHGQRDTVFDAAAGVEELHLSDDGGGEALSLGIFVELQQRSVAHEGCELFCNLGHSFIRQIDNLQFYNFAI